MIASKLLELKESTPAVGDGVVFQDWTDAGDEDDQYPDLLWGTVTKQSLCQRGFAVYTVDTLHSGRRTGVEQRTIAVVLPVGAA